MDLNQSNLIILFASIIFIFLVNRNNNNNYMVFIFNFILFSESITISFFFAKYPTYLLLPISLISFYYMSNFFRNNLPISDNDNDIGFLNRFDFFLFKPLGLSVILATFTYELFADGNLSSNSLLVITYGLLLIFYNSVSSQYNLQKKFLLSFLTCIILFLLLPLLLNKIRLGIVGQNSASIFLSESLIIEILLVKPLVTFLILLGYNVASTEESIFFEDTKANIFQEVLIAESCTGIYSVIIFVSAFISYLITNKALLNSNSLFLLIFGCLLAYVSNILRMATIIIVGHYFGMVALLWTHEYVGWVIFTAWLFMFWIIVEKLELKESNKI